MKINEKIKIKEKELMSRVTSNENDFREFLDVPEFLGFDYCVIGGLEDGVDQLGIRRVSFMLAKVVPQ